LLSYSHFPLKLVGQELLVQVGWLATGHNLTITSCPSDDHLDAIKWVSNTSSVLMIWTMNGLTRKIHIGGGSWSWFDYSLASIGKVKEQRPSAWLIFWVMLDALEQCCGHGRCSQQYVPVK